MSYMFGNLETEVAEVVTKINSLAKTNLNTLDQLRSGLVISKILASHLKKEKLEGIMPGKSKEIWQSNWETILSHGQNLLPNEWKSIRAYEIISDSGVLFTVIKLMIKKLWKPENPARRNSAKPIQSHQGPPRSIKTSEKSLKNIEKDFTIPNISEETKSQIHAWLVDLQVIPPSLYLHEFMYRIRTGISLSDLINRLEGKMEVIHGISKNPKTASYCIANINKTLEYLRKLPKVSSKYLWSSAEIYEGVEEHIYGLLLDIKNFYMTRYPNYLPRSSSTSKSIQKHKSLDDMFELTTVTNSMKRSIIQWIHSLGLERFIVFHKDYKKDYLFNGILLCEVISKVFSHKVKYIITPTTELQCAENFNSGLKVLNKETSIYHKFQTKVNEPSEDITWSVLWELMNNIQAYEEPDVSIFQKTLEESLILWIDSLKLLPPRVTTILELVPNFRNGVLLCQIVSSVFPDKKLEIILTPQTDHSALLNIRRSLSLLRNEAKMSQKYTWKEKEISQGNLKIITGLLEDLHKYADGVPKKNDESKPYLGSVYLSSTLKSVQSIEIPQPKKLQKAIELEEWLEGISIKTNGLSEDTLNEFKSGEKFLEIIKTLERTEIEGIHASPKTTAAALANIRKALELLYKKPAFDSKFMYLEDQILNGSGKVIRSLLAEIKKIYKNRLAW